MPPQVLNFHKITPGPERERERERLTFLEHQLTIVAGGVGANILLQVSVLVVVDPQALLPQDTSHILDAAGLACRRGALQQHWVAPETPEL